jgi:hypothetical protein
MAAQQATANGRADYEQMNWTNVSKIPFWQHTQL